jgi:hypothetical protein
LAEDGQDETSFHELGRWLQFEEDFGAGAITAKQMVQHAILRSSREFTVSRRFGEPPRNRESILFLEG